MGIVLTLGAYWQARRESAEECAERLSLFLSELAATDSALSVWYEKSKSRRKANQSRLDVGCVKTLADLLERGQNRRDVGGDVIADLGFHVGIWNGERSLKAMSLDVTCGAYSSNEQLGNNVLLDFPEDLGSLEQRERMQQVLAATAKAWEPNWAGVYSLGAMNNRAFSPTTPFVDWMVYLSREECPAPPAEQAISVTEINDIGTLIVVSKHPCRPDDPSHQSRVAAIESSISIKE
jgi:hypothetical protein